MNDASASAWTSGRPRQLGVWIATVWAGITRNVGFISKIELELGFVLTAASALGLLFVAAVEFRRNRANAQGGGPVAVT